MSSAEMMKLVPQTYIERFDKEQKESKSSNYLQLLCNNCSSYELILNPLIDCTFQEILHMKSAIIRRYQIRRKYLKIILKNIHLPDLIIKHVSTYIGLESLNDVFTIKCITP